jgi:thiazole/oxazole-forming peptide maturase SagD family component
LTKQVIYNGIWKNKFSEHEVDSAVILPQESAHPQPCEKCIEIYKTKLFAPQDKSTKFFPSKPILEELFSQHSYVLLYKDDEDNFLISSFPHIPFPSCPECKGKGNPLHSIKIDSQIPTDTLFANIIGDNTIQLSENSNIYCDATSFIAPDNNDPEKPIDYAFGSDFSPNNSAFYEAIERFYTFSKPQSTPLTYGSHPTLDKYNTIDTEAWNKYVDRKGRHKTKEGENYDWYACTDAKGSPFLAPCHAIYCNDWKKNEEDLYLTSSGCAVQTSFEKSCVVATLELIERHILLDSWLCCKPGFSISSVEHNHKCQAFIESMKNIGFDVYINELSNIKGLSIVIVILLNKANQWPAAAIGSSAKMNQESAVETALSEAYLNYLLQKRRGEEAIKLPDSFSAHTPSNPILHNHFYGLSNNQKYLQFWIDAPPSKNYIEPKEHYSFLTLEEKLLAKGIRTFYAPLSPDFMSNMDIHVVRCFSPDTIDMSFEIGGFRLPKTFDTRKILENKFLIPHPFC